MATPHYQVIRNWMKGMSSKGYAIFAEGDTIYSWGYHFPLAKFVTDTDGRSQVLVNSTPSTKSTTKHRTLVRRALMQLDCLVFEVPFVVTDDASHICNVMALSDRIGEMEAKARRARVHAMHHRQNASAIRNQLLLYRRHFGVAYPFSEPPQVTSESDLATAFKHELLREAARA